MKHRKLMSLYIILLALVIASMVGIKRSNGSVIRDYADVKAEGIIRIVTDYNSIDYFVSDDSIEAFQYELCRAISDLSGFEVQIMPETSLNECFKGLNNRRYDIIARNIPITSKNKDKYNFTQLQSWVLRKESVVLTDSLNRWLQVLKDNGVYP
ncbi:MAG: transporter substrate-binding domain-containing protein [Tannerella sp.]|nr:transporter substrate-binding domain-containing protein [Tannerella sp.]